MGPDMTYEREQDRRGIRLKIRMPAGNVPEGSADESKPNAAFIPGRFP